MRLLLDTHVVLWHLSGERELSTAAREAISAANDVLLSVVSLAEIGVKAAAGNLDVPSDLLARITATGIRTLGLTAAHGLAVAEIPLHHRDPFDRLIIAQATIERLTVVTADPQFQSYGVPLVGA